MEAKESILQAARELFVTKGFKGTSIRDIATASGSNVAMVNYYFKSKYNLFEIIFDEAFGVLIERLSQTFQSDKSFFEIIEEWVNVYYETLLRYPQIPVFILNEINQNPKALAVRIRKKDPFNLLQQMEKKMREEQEKGTIKEFSPMDFFLNVLSMCIFPFAFRDVAVSVAGRTDEEYDEVLENHKKYVVLFATEAIRK